MSSKSKRWDPMAGEVTAAVSNVRTKGLFVFGVKRQFLQEFAQASEVVILLNKEVLARTNISGSSDAIEKLMSCQEHRIIVSKNQGIEATRLVEETQAREKTNREQAERERVAGEQRDEIEKEKERDKAATAARSYIETERRLPRRSSNPLLTLS